MVAIDKLWLWMRGFLAIFRSEKGKGIFRGSDLSALFVNWNSLLSGFIFDGDNYDQPHYYTQEMLS